MNVDIPLEEENIIFARSMRGRGQGTGYVTIYGHLNRNETKQLVGNRHPAVLL